MADPAFSLERIFIKDLSFEVPNPKTVFGANWQPEVEVNLNSNSEKLNDSQYLVNLAVTVKATNNGETAFIAEVDQAGFFVLSDIPAEQVPQLLGAYCPNILFPFLREAVNDLVCRGNFPSLLLAPINFDAAFAEQQQKIAEQKVVPPPVGNA
jgi:preprotein translocase subunit SecB